MNWTDADLAERGYGPDGRRLNPAPRRVAPGVPRQSAGLQPGGSPSINGDPADTSKAGPARRSGYAGNGSQGCRLSTRAIAKLLPEQQLQIEVVAHWRPRLVPGARLLGINGELPGGGRTTALRAAIRRDMGYQKGQPDLVAMKHSRTVWLECKILGNNCSQEQSEFSAWAIRVGHGYCVITSIEDAGVVLRIWGMIA